jgi:hypothetical protein
MIFVWNINKYDIFFNLEYQYKKIENRSKQLLFIFLLDAILGQKLVEH